MSWNSWDAALEKGPGPFLFKLGCFCVPLLIGTICLFWFVGCFSETLQVSQEEFGPRALLKKYEWFKNASAALDARAASIRVYEQRFERLKKEYQGEPRNKWSREDREQANLWEQEVAGLRASFNNLAAEYNAQMAKFNWQFCNKGTLPQGATEPLPREYKPYKTE